MVPRMGMYVPTDVSFSGCYGNYLDILNNKVYEIRNIICRRKHRFIHNFISIFIDRNLRKSIYSIFFFNLLCSPVVFFQYSKRVKNILASTQAHYTKKVNV